MMEVCDNTKGKLAITNFEVVERLNGYTLVHFELKTGRTHQLRLHSAYSLKAPIVGDGLYGRKAGFDDALRSMLVTNNLFLFAYKLERRQLQSPLCI